MAETNDNAIHIADGMSMAASIANGMVVAFTDHMTPAQAADCMRSLIAKAIREHAESIRQSAFERQRERQDNG